METHLFGFFDRFLVLIFFAFPDLISNKFFGEIFPVFLACLVEIFLWLLLRRISMIRILHFCKILIESHSLLEWWGGLICFMFFLGQHTVQQNYVLVNYLYSQGEINITIDLLHNFQHFIIQKSSWNLQSQILWFSGFLVFIYHQ